jgi:hypothetical protein
MWGESSTYNYTIGVWEENILYLSSGKVTWLAFSIEGHRRNY